ncbi:MAG: translation initiation factor [Cytophagales bacterium]|nr:translation initiation factor [Armatimonadota bacterium]
MSGLVYSTQQGRLCPDCGQPVAKCDCARTRPAARVSRAPSATVNPVPRDGIVRVGRETKGRKGKGVTIVTGVPLPAAELAALCTALKKKCGSGGALKEGVIEIQGDHRDTIADEMTAQGWTVKRMGG